MAARLPDLPETLESLGKRIRFLRGKRNATEYARKIGVHANTLLNYERGESSPNSNILIKLCQLEQVGADWLLLGVSAQANTAETVRYRREVLELIGTAAHELAPPKLGHRFGKLLAMAYEQAALYKIDQQSVEKIIEDLVELLEPKTRIGSCDARNTNQDSRTAC